jgi:ParB family chromosome partitioning protein
VPANRSVVANSSGDEEFRRVPLERIIPNPQQPRQHFSEAALQHLAQSIRTQGVLQPLVVRESGEECYELIAGERRWRALKLLDAEDAPVVVRNIPDEAMLEVALLENIQRENLTPIEEARSYRQLVEQYGYTQEALARRLGKDRSTIANLMRLLHLTTPVQNDLESGRLTIGHARALLALPDEAAQLHLRERLLRHGWNVRETERQVRAWLARLPQAAQPDDLHSGSSSMPSTRLRPEIKALEDELTRMLGTRVALTYRNGRGSLRIDYHSLEEFEQLYERLIGS